MADLMSQLPTSVDVVGEQDAVQLEVSVTMQAWLARLGRDWTARMLQAL